MSNVIPFRLRVGKDDDLKKSLDCIPRNIEKSDIIREALRLYFFNSPTPLRNSVVNSEGSSNQEPSLQKIAPPIVTTKSTSFKEDNTVDSRLDNLLKF